MTFHLIHLSPSPRTQSSALRPEVFQTRVYFRRRGRRGAVPRVFGQPETSAQGHPLLPSRSNSLSVLRESYAWGPLPLIENPRLGVPQIWVEAASSEPHPRIAWGPASAGRRGYAATKRFGGNAPKPLAQGGFTPPEHVSIGRRSPKRGHPNGCPSFFGAEDEARTAFSGPRKLSFLGTPTWIGKIRGYTADLGGGSEFEPHPRIAWGPASNGTAGTPSQAVWGQRPKTPGRRADSFRPSRSNSQVTKKDVLPDVLFLERGRGSEL